MTRNSIIDRNNETLREVIRSSPYYHNSLDPWLMNMRGHRLNTLACDVTLANNGGGLFYTDDLDIARRVTPGGVLVASEGGSSLKYSGVQYQAGFNEDKSLHTFDTKTVEAEVEREDTILVCSRVADRRTVARYKKIEDTTKVKLENLNFDYGSRSGSWSERPSLFMPTPRRAIAMDTVTVNSQGETKYRFNGRGSTDITTNEWFPIIKKGDIKDLVMVDANVENGRLVVQTTDGRLVGEQVTPSVEVYPFASTPLQAKMSVNFSTVRIGKDPEKTLRKLDRLAKSLDALAPREVR